MLGRQASAVEDAAERRARGDARAASSVVCGVRVGRAPPVSRKARAGPVAKLISGFPSLACPAADDIGKLYAALRMA